MKENLFDDNSSTFDNWVNTNRINVPQHFFMAMAFLPLLHKDPKPNTAIPES